MTQNYNIRQVPDQYLKRCVLSLMQQRNNYNKSLKIAENKQRKATYSPCGRDGHYASDLTENRSLVSTPHRGEPVGILQRCLVGLLGKMGYRNVTDRQTDGQTELLYQYRASAVLC